MSAQLRREVLQAYKRCLQVTNAVFVNDPKNIAFVRDDAHRNFMANSDLTNETEIRAKIEEALGAADVMEKFVMQISFNEEGKGVARMRPEMEFDEFEEGVPGDFDPSKGGCCGGGEPLVIEPKSG